MRIVRAGAVVAAAVLLGVTAVGLGSASAGDKGGGGKGGGGGGGGGGHHNPPNHGGPTVDIQILAINDFHGNLEPPAGSSGRVGTVNAGGAEYLATHVKAHEATNPRNTIVVSAGDLIGASPLLSGLFHDEPTIEAMNSIGLDLNAVGNHEFDEGATELLRMQNGRCHPVDGCLDGDGFRGADFDFLAANVVDQRGRTLFPGYSIENFNGAKVAFIGMTLEGTPNIVSPSGIVGLSFRDEADTANAIVRDLKRRNVEAIVVLIHEGGLPAALDINGCNGVSGPIVDIVNRLDTEVDLVISGHTHQPYVCNFNGIPVTSAYSFGRVLTDIDLKVSKSGKDVVGPITINNTIVTRDVAADPAITSLIARYNAVAAPIRDRVIGQISADINRVNDTSLEQPLGNAIADAQLAATTATGSAVMAFMNPGGVRTDLVYAGSAAGEGDGNVTYGEAFAVQPFGNSLVTMTLTGAQIDDMLEQQFCGLNDGLGTPINVAFKVLLPSAGVHYTWNKPLADQADPNCTLDVVTGLNLNGGPVLDDATYRVTVNSFLADGGDGFSALVGGTDRLGGAVDTDAFEAYLQSLGAPLAPPATDRIDVTP